MKVNVTAKGYTNVILVLNMKRFVQEQDQSRFERIRGREEFSQTLRGTWLQKMSLQNKFITIEEEKRRRGQPDTMSTENVGFATGVFRSLMLERFSSPGYALDKDKIQFDEDLMSNFQFKTLFWKVWSKWSIYIRPTHNGFFVIRLTSRHIEQPRSFVRLAQDVLRLQESLDVRSAINWLDSAREKYKNDPEALKTKERSVSAFLEWLGVDEHYTGDVLYYPVQWRLAMEVCSLFVEAIGSEINIDGEKEVIRLRTPKPSISIPLHDSYVIHHFNDLFANEGIVKRAKRNVNNKNSQISIGLNDIRESPQIRQAILNLAEGVVLKEQYVVTTGDTLDASLSAFPNHRWKIVDEILDKNLATWSDEVCLMNSRTSMILPSPKWREYEILVSSTPSSTLQVKYHRYWGSIERMIEFIFEIRVLAQLLESASYDLLTELAERIHRTQSRLFIGDIIMDEKLPELATRAAFLRRQAALCQSLSHPQLWSRADFAITKAEFLFDQLGVPRILQHIERNINSIVEFVDHIDELYLADLSEKGNENSNWLSMVLAAASLTLTFLILPSFWADTEQVYQFSPNNLYFFLNAIKWIGNGLSIILIGLAIWLFGIAFIQKRQFADFLKKIKKNKGKNPLDS